MIFTHWSIVRCRRRLLGNLYSNKLVSTRNGNAYILPSNCLLSVKETYERMSHRNNGLCVIFNSIKTMTVSKYFLEQRKTNVWYCIWIRAPGEVRLLTCIISLHSMQFSKLWRAHAKVPVSNFPLSYSRIAINGSRAILVLRIYRRTKERNVNRSRRWPGKKRFARKFQTSGADTSIGNVNEISKQMAEITFGVAVIKIQISFDWRRHDLTRLIRTPIMMSNWNCD